MLIEELIPNCDEVDAGVEPTVAFERRATEIAEMARLQLTEQIRAHFERELEARIASMRSEVEQPLHAELLDEIAATQQQLEAKEAEIASNMASDSFNLGVVLKLKEERLKLISYLKGLQFHTKKGL